MSDKFVRKPVGNFFIKKSLQMRLISKVVIASLISTLVSSGSLLLVYIMRYNTIAVYQLDHVTNEINRESIIYLILPTLLISSIVGLIVAIGIGLYASRKYAVPIYKIEQWASLLIKGRMTALLRFREKEEMRELSEKCNELGSKISTTFSEIKQKVKQLETEQPDNPQIKGIITLLDDFELTEQPLEVATGIYTKE